MIPSGSSDWTGRLNTKQRIAVDQWVHESMVPSSMPEAIALEDLVLILAGLLSDDPDLSAAGNKLAAWSHAAIHEPEEQSTPEHQVTRYKKPLDTKICCSSAISIVEFLHELVSREVLIIHQGLVHRGRRFGATGS